MTTQNQINTEETHELAGRPTIPSHTKPFSLPPGFDPGTYPHYNVQSSIYSLLMSALSLAENYERLPGAEERMLLIERAIMAYQATCEPLRFTAP